MYENIYRLLNLCVTGMVLVRVDTYMPQQTMARIMTCMTV